MNDENPLLLETRDRLGIITFNRPRQRNALTPDMLVALVKALDIWATEDSVRTVLITGSGDKAFSSGFDITAIPTEEDPHLQQKLAENDPLAQALLAVKAFPYPTIAMLNGQCFGGALNLALCCDLRIGVDDLVIAMPPARLGVVYPADGVAQFVSVMGQAKTRELFFTGRAYNATDARDMGLLHRVVPRDDLERETLRLVSEITANAPLALKGLKRTLNLLEAKGLLNEPEQDEVRQLAAQAIQSEDAREAKQAFIEKRAPVFTGR